MNMNFGHKWEKTSEAREDITLLPAKGDHTQKSIQNETAESYDSDKGIRGKKHRKISKWSGYYQPPWRL